MKLGFVERDHAIQRLVAAGADVDNRLRAMEMRCAAFETQLKGVVVDAPDIESQVRRFRSGSAIQVP